VEFRQLPARPDHPRYAARLKTIEGLLKQRKDRLVEEGMILDRATAEDDLWWFCKRFTSFNCYRVAEVGHPMRGSLWIDHPFVFWACRQYQGVYVEPDGSDFWPNGTRGWVWIKFHRLAIKTTLLLASFLWLHARDEAETILLATHKADEVGSGMGRGLLADLQTPLLTDTWEQFRYMQEARKQGYVVDRLPGPREQSLMVASIVASVTSVHPGRYAFDDAVSDKLRDNPDQIAKISKNISAYAALMPPDASVIVCNTPWDEADPWVQREKEGLFAKVVRQGATTGGDFTPPGEANMHTRKYFDLQRKKINDDSLYFPQYELVFYRSAAVLFDWAWIKEYHEEPEELARQSPYINIIVDGAKGTQGGDFTVIRVITWTGHDRWANLDLIRERIGVSKAMQILLGRDKNDPTTRWIEEAYTPGGVGVVERWMKIDPMLTVWFDDHANAGWIDSFAEHIRLRRIKFNGKAPTVRKWPEVHQTRNSSKEKRAGYTKFWRIRQLEGPYQQGKVAYPAKGFGHGSWNGITDGPDGRDVKVQFQQDEFNRMKLDALPTHDDMLDAESIIALPQTQAHMRRPAQGSGYQLGGMEFPVPTVNNPFGLPGGGHGIMAGKDEGRSWLSW
jgi:hypothetical protein